MPPADTRSGFSSDGEGDPAVREHHRAPLDTNTLTHSG